MKRKINLKWISYCLVALVPFVFFSLKTTLPSYLYYYKIGMLSLQDFVKIIYLGPYRREVAYPIILTSVYLILQAKLVGQVQLHEIIRYQDIKDYFKQRFRKGLVLALATTTVYEAVSLIYLPLVGSRDFFTTFYMKLEITQILIVAGYLVLLFGVCELLSLRFSIGIPQGVTILISAGMFFLAKLTEFWTPVRELPIHIVSYNNLAVETVSVSFFKVVISILFVYSVFLYMLKKEDFI